MSEVDSKVKKALKALDAYYGYDQEKIDYIVKKASVAALNKHLVLAKHANEETGRGRIEDKATKNIFACEEVTNYLKNQKTVGVIEKNDVTGITKIADPVGVIAGITPVTNPTSTAIFKSLLAIKTRNPIIFGFHPGAQNSSIAAAKFVYDAAVEAGAPKDCIQWIEKPSLEASNELMNHDGVATILATGGNAMVKSAYSCGKPALGVGAGNVPSYVEKTANINQAANDIVLSKSFDYGMICASEQVVIVDSPVYSKFLTEVKKLHAYVANDKEKKMLEEYIFGVSAYSKNCADQKLNPFIVGKSPQVIAKNAGFEVPEDTTIIIAEIKKIGKEEPLSAEKLSPVLGLIKASSTEQAFDYAEAILDNGGLGHSACIHSYNDQLVEDYGTRMKACRVLQNTPTSVGGIGDLYNAIIPSLTLGCGSYGHNSVSGNVSAVNLLNVKSVARRNNNMQWFKIPGKTYIEPNAIQYLHDMEGVERVAIVTDKVMNEIGVVQKILDELRTRDNTVTTTVIDYIEPEPSVETVTRGANELKAFKPDTIIALGGGSPMDASKVMRLLYEHEEIEFSDIREKFLDIRKRAFKLPANKGKAKLVCIPTSSGTGSEVTPFAVITDHSTGYKYPLADYVLTPDVAIVDPVLAQTQPPRLAADSGFDALTHSIESFTSVFANDFTDGLAKQAFGLIFNNITASVNEGKANTKAQEKMHNAATIAGMAFGSAFLGMCHGMAHTIGALFHVAHGRTNAILLPHIIRYNGQTPTKATAWPKYNEYQCAAKYRELTDILKINTSSDKDAIEKLAKAVEKLRDSVHIDKSFQAAGVDEKEFLKSLDAITMRAYEDQCTPANPRVPLLDDMKVIAVSAYYGIDFDSAKAKLAKLK
jgi:acetaldehyde dehydrogenase/alcohol dehydrogenase